MLDAAFEIVVAKPQDASHSVILSAPMEVGSSTWAGEMAADWIEDWQDPELPGVYLVTLEQLSDTTGDGYREPRETEVVYTMPPKSSSMILLFSYPDLSWTAAEPEGFAPCDIAPNAG